MSWDIDVAVIGAGVVGLACSAALARAGYSVLCLEAESAFGTITSARNSEVSHAGIYYPAGSLKARLCVEGNRRLPQWCADHGVEYRVTGKLIVATDDAEAERLGSIQAAAAANGVMLEWLDSAQAMAREPALSCAAALWSPTTAIIDSHGLMLACLGEAEQHGASLVLQTPVLGGRPLPSGGLELECGGAEPMTLRCRVVVNAAGLSAQKVNATIAGLAPDHIPPLTLAKGNYFDLGTQPPFRTLVYPVPVNGGLGVHYTVDMAGRGRFGPDVEWLDHADPARIDYRVDPRRGDAFYAAIRRYWPGLPDQALQPAYSGVRPKIPALAGGTADFMIQTPADCGIDGLFTLYGIESPGLTSSLPLADHVARLLVEWL
ncbi:NAD(P)/FAD-dependent oxidoreductase [Insolitispirillum peregrinum]|uniref:NAD(P)/FAD-dependent oxidoreductase n=1 Tax=Insolitispirillum peregrinum TaxID=80876 RepID=UPI0036227615